MKSVPLRRRLFLLAAAGILPLAIMSGIGLMALFQQQRDQGGQAGLEIARALSIAVDAELRRSVSALEILGTSLHLDDRDLDSFAEHAKRALASQPQWEGVVLTDAGGKLLVRTGAKPGEPFQPVIEMESFRSAVSTRKAAIGYLRRDPLEKTWGIPVRIPVTLAGNVRYVLSAVVKPESILEVVRRQRVPEGWVVTVADAKGLQVARSRDNEAAVGTPPSPALVSDIGNPDHEWHGIT
ncbi:MAG TPA: cache domain-containing protein, partial [Usitatibacter sp.]